MNIVIINHNIPNIISLVNETMIASVVEMAVKLGLIIARANHAAERLPVTADDAFRNARLFLLINKTIT